MGPYLKSLNWALTPQDHRRLAALPILVGTGFLAGPPAVRVPAGGRPRPRAVQRRAAARARRWTRPTPWSMRMTRELEACSEVTGVYASVGSDGVNKAQRRPPTWCRRANGSASATSAARWSTSSRPIPGARIGAAATTAAVPATAPAIPCGWSATTARSWKPPPARSSAQMRGGAGPRQRGHHRGHRPSRDHRARPSPTRPPGPGVSAGAISQAVRVATIGDIDQSLPKYNLGDRQVPIRLRLTDDARENMSVLETLKVPSSHGGSVPLNAVADVRFGAGPSQISRQDRAPCGRDHRRTRRHRGRRGRKRVHALSAVKNLPARRQGGGRRRRRVHRRRWSPASPPRS